MTIRATSHVAILASLLSVFAVAQASAQTKTDETLPSQRQRKRRVCDRANRQLGLQPEPTTEFPDTNTASSTGVKVNPSQVQQKAATPPPPGAHKTSSVGQNVSVATPADSDSWVEQIDVDGNGVAEQTNLVWDSKDKVLFSDSAGTFACQNGATGNGELFVSVNAAGNRWGRPAGSGFWVASMDKGQCGLPQNALWGCKFDASGNPTECGVASIDQQNNDIVIVTAQR